MSDDINKDDPILDDNGTAPPAPDTLPEDPPAAKAAAQPADQADGLAKARAEAAEYLEGWQRARAEFANYRKRTDRERKDLKQLAAADTLKQFLPVIDDLERAMDNTPDELGENSWVQGVLMISGKLKTLLENSGLEEINPVGEAFDPTRHEAIGMDDSGEFESGHVTLVLQKGYVYGDTILRPAMVRVAN